MANAMKKAAIQDDVVMALGEDPDNGSDPASAALAELIDTAGLVHVLTLLRDAADFAGAHADGDASSRFKLARALESAIAAAEGK